MPFNKNDKANREDRADFKKKPIRRRKKICIFCADKNYTWVDYKDTNKLRKFISERGKILPRRISGNCAKHPRNSKRPFCPIPDSATGIPANRRRVGR